MIMGHFRDDIPSQSLDWCKTYNILNQSHGWLWHN